MRILLLSGGLSIVTTDYVGYYKFDETSGTVAIDSSPNGNNGTYSGTTSSTIVPPAITFSDPRSRSFNGTSDLVTLPNVSVLKPSSAGSILGWARAANFSFINPIYVANTFSNGFPGISFYLNSTSGKIGVDWGTTAAQSLAGGTSLVGNIWHHVACTWDGSTMRVYLDGVQDGSSAMTQQVAQSANAPTIGTGGTRFFNGLLDDLLVYSRALTAAEIAYKAGGGA